MGAAPIKAAWEVAEDSGFRRIVRTGEAVAVAASAHTVHVEVTGLKPNRWYWYRFHALGQSSAVGRSRTTHPRLVTSRPL